MINGIVFLHIDNFLTDFELNETRHGKFHD